MSRIYQRLRGFFNNRKPSYDPYPEDSYNEERSDPPKNLPDQLDENEDDNKDDVKSVKNDNPSQQTTLQRQTRGRTPLDERPPSTSTNLPNSQLRTVANNIQPTLPPNNTISTNVNTEAASIPNPSARAGGLPTQDPASDPPVNPVPQTSLPSTNQLPQTSLPSTNPPPQTPLRDRFPFLQNKTQVPFRISPNTTLVGFPPNPNRRPTWLNRTNFAPQQNRPVFPTRPQTNISNIQADYPIEKILIDENIPSSIAIKINETVEHDRFGNNYYKQHYAYKPKTQYIAINNSQQIQRPLTGNSHHAGMRYIREINNEKSYPHPQKQKSNNIQLIIDNTPQVIYLCQHDYNPFPLPINHYIASASPNDPMRHY